MKKDYLWQKMIATDVNTFKNWHEDVKPTVYVNWRNILRKQEVTSDGISYGNGCYHNS